MSNGTDSDGDIAGLSFCQHAELLREFDRLEESRDVHPDEIFECDVCGATMTAGDLVMERLGRADAGRHVLPDEDPDFD